MARSTYPPRLADLIRLGFADDLSARNEGRSGNRTEVQKSLRYPSLADDAAFATAAQEDAPPAPELDDQGKPVLDVRPMTPDDVFGVARLAYRTYGYSASHAETFFQPERFAEYVRVGSHDGRDVVGSLRDREPAPQVVVERVVQVIGEAEEHVDARALDFRVDDDDPGRPEGSRFRGSPPVSTRSDQALKPRNSNSSSGTAAPDVAPKAL